jgi:hypothetical protein
MKYFLLVLSLVLFCTCSTSVKNNSEDWIILFDGTSLDGWRAYNGKQMPPGWKIVNKELTFTTEQILEKDYNYEGSRDIIYGAEEFDNFELYVEWSIPAGGNSGIFYHIKEGYEAPYFVAPEYQLVDDLNYTKIHNLTNYNTHTGANEPEQLKDWQKTAADYAMYAPDLAHKILNPVGEWNTSKIIFTPENVEYWLNGKKVLSFIPWSQDWNERKNSGKWKGAPDYGKYKKGYIGFQDHGSNLSFKNIKIKKI